MNAKDAIKYGLTSTQNMVSMYLSDLSDADLLVRPAPKANHIAWQLGHLIHAECGMVKGNIPSAKPPALPDGFEKQHGKETSHADSAKGFLTKQQYLDLFNKARAATLEALAGLSEADLDKPTQGPIAPFAPKLGDLFNLQAHHALMHAGQFTVVRRKLDKPVLF